MSTIKEDSEGLYVEIEGWICRPPEGTRPAKAGLTTEYIEGTKFKKGDKVRGSHPPGHLAYLRIGKRNTPGYRMETWNVIDLTDKAEAAYQQYKGGKS